MSICGVEVIPKIYERQTETRGGSRFIIPYLPWSHPSNGVVRERESGLLIINELATDPRLSHDLCVKRSVRKGEFWRVELLNYFAARALVYGPEGFADRSVLRRYGSQKCCPA